MKMVEEVEGINNLDVDEVIRPGGVKFIIGDGRLFLKETKKKYDVIIVNVPDPLNLQLNRYYTEDFFRMAKRSLNTGGVFSISHTSSENFISDIQSIVLRSINNSLEGVFDSVTVFPGSIVHFIAGESKVSVGSLFGNLDKRNLDTKFISRDFLPFRFSEERMEFIVSNIRDAKNVDINRDVLPALTAYELFLEFSRKGFSFSKWVNIFSGNRKWIPVLAWAMIIVVIFLIPGKENAAKLDIWGVGLTSFLFQINVLLSYQSFSGYLYDGIVFLTAFFMAGISVGTWSGSKRSFRLAKDPKLIHAAFILFSVFYVGWLFVIERINISILACSTGFSVASFIGGVFTGMFYRVVVSSVLDRLNNQEPAIFYAWDMFGACVGGLLGGIFIYPFSGSIGIIYLFVFIHLASVLLLTRRWGKFYLP
jgi:spermidine synthase